MNPRDAGAYFQLGKSCRGQGRWPEAETALKKALEIEPQNSCACAELGALYGDQGRFPEAEAQCRKAIASDPNQGMAYLYLSHIYLSQGRSRDAEAACQKAIAIDPRASGAHCQLGKICRGQGRSAEAEAAFRKGLEADPRIGWAWVELGVLCKDQGRFPEAEAALRKAIAIDPRDGGAHLQLGNVHRRQGRWPEAEAEFKKAIAIDPRDGRARMGLGAVLRSQGRTAEAEAHRGGQGAAADARERAFCVLPWTHLHVRADGSCRPCCVWNGPSVGNARSASLDELWNSPGLKALRADMVNGRPAAGCSRCFENEQAGFWSVRQEKNSFLSRHRSRERLTAPDGTLPRLPVLFLDFRFSNVCNLRCRTCDPTQSSAWAADARALGLPVPGEPVLKPYDDWDALWRQLRPLLEEGPEEILFVGGEPLLMEEHYRILDFLIARGRTDVRLTYNTNFSILRFQGWDALDLWPRFRNVHVAASLDGSGRRGEYLRKGLNWAAAVANREEMLRRCPDVGFSILATLSIFNALHLPDFHREWVEKGYVERNAFALNMLVAPEIYRMQVLPSALKERALEAYRRHQEAFLDADDLAARDFAAAARSLQAQDCSDLLPEFVAMTRRLDQLRGEDCREVFPELAGLFEAAA